MKTKEQLYLENLQKSYLELKKENEQLKKELKENEFWRSWYEEMNKQLFLENNILKNISTQNIEPEIVKMVNDNFENLLLKLK